MTARPLRAPADDGGVLVEPAPDAVAGLFDANARRLAAWEYNFQGRQAGLLRTQVRSEVVTAARAYLARHGLGGSFADLDDSDGGARPLVVTGHQPELFHPGVWIKNFAAGSIAGAQGGVGINLIIDHDIPKSCAIDVPVVDAGGVRLVPVEFDESWGDAPYEERAVAEEGTFATFADRVRRVSDGAVAGSLLDDFWPRVLARRGEARTSGARFALARRELEAAWGVSNLEVPFSLVCQTDGFLWFVSHILAQLPRFQQIHNSSLYQYRAAHRIRSRNHPVAALEREGEWHEAPFWVWRQGQPRRHPLLARQRGAFLDLRIAGEDEILVELPLAADREACCAVERLRELLARSIRLRTRALTTTMFSRLMLADLFIHGIGGAKYDELGDEIVRRFFGIEPPGFLTVSLTLWLELPRDFAPAGELATIERRLRDLRFNPDRYLSEPYSEEIRTLIRRRAEAISAPFDSRRERRARCLTIRACNAGLQPWVRRAYEDLMSLRSRARQHARSLRAARNRDFAFVLHRAARLQRHMLGAVRGA
jgi:hypothetical protein